jgi:hypothetical protein
MKRSLIHYLLSLSIFSLFIFGIPMCEHIEVVMHEATPGTYVTGVILDKMGGAPVSYATVEVENSNIPSVVAGEDGRYEIPVPAGVYFSIIAKKEGRAYSKIQDLGKLEEGEILEDVNIILAEVYNLVPYNDPDIGTSYNLLGAPMIEVDGLEMGDVIAFNEKRDIRIRVRAPNPLAQTQHVGAPLRCFLGRKWLPMGFGAIAVSRSDQLRFIWDSANRTVGETYFHIVAMDMNHNRVEKTIPIQILPELEDPSRVPAKVNTEKVSISGITFGDRLEYYQRMGADAVGGGYIQNPIGKQYTKYVRIFWEKIVECKGYKVYRSDTGPDGTYTRIAEYPQSPHVAKDICSGNGRYPHLGDNRPNCETRLQTVDMDPTLTIGKTYWYRISAYNAYGEGPMTDPKPIELLEPYWVTLIGPGGNGQQGEMEDGLPQSIEVVTSLKPIFEWEVTPCPGADIRQDYLLVFPATSWFHTGSWGEFMPEFEPNTRFNYSPDWSRPRNYALFEADPVRELRMLRGFGTRTNGDTYLSNHPVARWQDMDLRLSVQPLEAGTAYLWSINKSVAKKAIPVTYYEDDGVTIDQVTYDGTCNAYSFSAGYQMFGDEHQAWNGPFYFATDAGGKPVPPTFVSNPIPGDANALIYLRQFGGQFDDIETTYPSSDEKGEMILLWYGGFLFNGQCVVDPQLKGYYVYINEGAPCPNISTCPKLFNPAGGSVDFYLFTTDGVIIPDGPNISLTPTKITGEPGAIYYVQITSVSVDGIKSDPTDVYPFQIPGQFERPEDRPPTIDNLKVIQVTSDAITIEWNPIDRFKYPIFGGYYGITIATSSDGQNYIPFYVFDDDGNREDLTEGTLAAFTDKTRYTIDLEEHFEDYSGRTFFIRVFGIDTNMNPNGHMDKEGARDGVDEDLSWLMSNPQVSATTF